MKLMDDIAEGEDKYPVAIIVESEEELRAVYALANVSTDDVKRMSSNYLKYPEWQTLDRLKGMLWGRINNVCVKYGYKQE